MYMRVPEAISSMLKTWQKASAMLLTMSNTAQAYSTFDLALIVEGILRYPDSEV